MSPRSEGDERNRRVRCLVYVIMRFRVPSDDAARFRTQARAAMGLLAQRDGYHGGRLGRAFDDPTLWAMTTEWADVGSYRRALSSYEVKLGAVELLSRAVDEPSAFEDLSDDEHSARAADADVVGLGEAAAPTVLTDFD